MRRPGALLLTAALVFLPACAERAPARGVVLVLLDTVRADRLSPYGHARDTTPHLAALAEDGVLFEQAVSTSAWTLPSVAAILAARHPTARVYRHRLLTSCVEHLRAHGVRTAAFTEGAYVSRAFGLDRGFETWWEREGPVTLDPRVRRPVRGAGGGAGRGGIESTFSRALAWLRAHGGRGEPFFLLIHTYEAHTPYRRREFAEGLPSGGLGETYEIRDVARVMHGDLPMGDTELAYVRALYDGGLRHADRHLGILRQALARLDLADDTLVIVSSDHGEDLGRFPRHAGNHGHTLYDEQVRVPLVMGGATGPVARRRIEVPVRTLDILPTTLEALGVPPLPGLDGRSLLPLIRGRETAGRPAWMRTPPVGGRPERTALRTGAYKLILSAPDAEPETPPVEVFDLAKDPGEQRNLAGSRPDLARALRRDLERARARVHEEGPPEWRPAPGGVPEDLRQRLRSLGYAD